MLKGQAVICLDRFESNCVILRNKKNHRDRELLSRDLLGNSHLELRESAVWTRAKNAIRKKTTSALAVVAALYLLYLLRCNGLLTRKMPFMPTTILACWGKLLQPHPPPPTSNSWC